MKTRVPRQEFQDALAAVATLAGGRTTKPILGCVKLVVEQDRIDLAATDGEAALRVGTSSLVVDQPGQAVVPADRLLSIVRELGDAEITLEATESRFVIRGEGSEFKIYGHRPEDFPPLPVFEGDTDLTIDGAQVRRMIAWTIYAAARETSRYAINGVLWEKRGKKLAMIATDGRRLARVAGVTQGGKSGDFDVIIPSKALNIFERVFTGGDDSWTVDLKVMPNQVLFRSGDRLMATALVEGHFPKYEDVIPKDNDRKVRVDRAEFYSAMRRAALLTTEESRAVKLVFTPGQLLVTSQSPEQGEARVELPIEYSSDEIQIGFNPAFVIDALRAVTFEEIVIELKESTRPAIIRGEEKSEFLYVVMPVSLAT